MDYFEERKRSVDVEALNPDQAEKIGEEIGKLIGKAGDEVSIKINKVLSIYGLSAKVAIQLIDNKTGQPVLI